MGSTSKTKSLSESINEWRANRIDGLLEAETERDRLRETLRRLEVLLIDDDFWATRSVVKRAVEIIGPDHTSIRVQRDTLAEAIDAAWAMREEGR